MLDQEPAPVVVVVVRRVQFSGRGPVVWGLLHFITQSRVDLKESRSGVDG